MDYLYTKLLDEPHELCMMAKEDIQKAYLDSCKKAIKDIAVRNKERETLSSKANNLAAELMAAYDKGDKLLVSDIMEKIARNIAK